MVTGITLSIPVPTLVSDQVISDRALRTATAEEIHRCPTTFFHRLLAEPFWGRCVARRVDLIELGENALDALDAFL